MNGFNELKSKGEKFDSVHKISIRSTQEKVFEFCLHMGQDIEDKIFKLSSSIQTDTYNQKVRQIVSNLRNSINSELRV